MPKFTPGPLTIEHTTNETTPYRIVAKGRRNPVALIKHKGLMENDDEECKGNAILYSKAPEIYDLLNEFLCDEEILCADVRNEPLCIKARKLLAEIDS